MKKLIVIALLGLTFGIKAQSISAGAGSSTVKINADGKLTVAGVLKGKILADGTIQNASNVTIGYIQGNGTIENASHTAVGYFMSNYDVHNAAHTVIGHLRTTLQVKNAAQVVLGTYDEHISTMWTAVAYFFFQP
jgi:hypothetical protein